MEGGTFESGILDLVQRSGERFREPMFRPDSPCPLKESKNRECFLELRVVGLHKYVIS